MLNYLISTYLGADLLLTRILVSPNGEIDELFESVTQNLIDWRMYTICMEANLRTIAQESETFLKIPKFQRSYSWTETEWENFWYKIAERALEINTSDTSHSAIFMGAIVFKEDRKETIGSKEFKSNFIIDGQQRFVTISVFFAALRDLYFAQKSAPYATWTNSFLSVPLDMMAKESRIRLELQDVDDEEYQLLVGLKTEETWNQIITGSHPLFKLYRFFLDKLSQSIDSTLTDITSEEDADDVDERNLENDQSNSQPLHYLQATYIEEGGNDRQWKSFDNFDPQTLTNIIAQQMKFAVIEIQEVDDEIAFEVFDMLNAHGQPLAAVDKFRNGFFMLDPEKSNENYNKYWLPMEKKVGNPSILSTFFHEETNRRFGLTPKDKTYQELMTRIKKKSLSPGKGSSSSSRHTNTVREFKELKDALDAFMIVHKGKDSLSGANSEGQIYASHLDFLSKIVSGPATPLLMDLLIWTRDSRTKPEVLKELNEILSSIEGLLVRRLLGGIKPQQLRSLLADVPKKLNGQMLDIDPKLECTAENLRIYNRLLRKHMLTWGAERFPSDNALLSNPLRDVYQSTGRKISLFSILFDLERSLNDERKSDLVPKYGKGKDNWSIEHVLPQGTKQNDNDTFVMNSEWRKDWEEWKVGDVEVNFIKCVHSLGNLTILKNGTNASVSDDPFSKKLVQYKNKTTAKLTDDIKTEKQWTPQQIEDRSIALLKLVIQKWPYPKGTEND